MIRIGLDFEGSTGKWPLRRQRGESTVLINRWHLDQPFGKPRFRGRASGPYGKKSRGDTIRTCDLYVPNVAL